jgi:hypothetical protein
MAPISIVLTAMSRWRCKAASVSGNPTLAKAIFAAFWINPDAGTARLLHDGRAGAVTRRAFTFRWIDDGVFSSEFFQPRR